MKSNRKIRVSRIVALERLEERANPSTVTGVPAPLINTVSLVPAIENAYATFATAVRTAESTLVGKTPPTTTTVAAQADQAAAQLDAQLNATFAQTHNASTYLLPTIQAQLTGSGSNLTTSMNNLLSALGSTQTNGGNRTATLAATFQSMEALIAQSFSTTSTDLYFFANNQNASATGQAGSNLNVGQVLPTIQNNFSSFANSVRQTEATLTGSSPASAATVNGQLQQLVAQLSAQNASALQMNSLATSQATPILQSELTGAGPGLSSLLSGLVSSSPVYSNSSAVSLRTTPGNPAVGGGLVNTLPVYTPPGTNDPAILGGLPSSSSTSRLAGISDPAILSAAFEGLMAGSYQAASSNLALFAIPSTAVRPGATAMASGSIYASTGGSAATLSNGSSGVGTIPLGNGSISHVGSTRNALHNGRGFSANTFSSNLTGNGNGIFQNGSGRLNGTSNLNSFNRGFFANTTGNGFLNTGASVPIGSGGAAGFTTSNGIGTNGSSFFNNINTSSFFNGGNGPIFPGQGSSLFSPTNVVGSGGLNGPTFGGGNNGGLFGPSFTTNTTSPFGPATF